MAPDTLFGDRRDAGRLLSARLLSHRDETPLVLGLPRGGVPVAVEVARALGAPLDVWIVRKVGAPVQPELAMGAIAEGGEVFVDHHIVRLAGASEAEVQEILRAEAAEIEPRAQRFRGGRPPPDPSGRTVIVVDDGVATGATARAALRAIRKRGPKRLVLAVPVGAVDPLTSLRPDADEIVCLWARDDLSSIGEYYEDFAPVSDQDVVAMLDRARAEQGTLGAPPEREVSIDASGATLRGDLAIPQGASGIVLFAHGSGSSRKSPRNRFVAGALRQAGLATLLFDLLTEDEERLDAIDAHLRFDIDLLAQRLVAAIEWAGRQADTRGLRVGLFGASTGAAAALVAAADRREAVGAVVSRGGRPDLAGAALARVVAPTLLLVGGFDYEVLELNRRAMKLMPATKKLEVIPGATHLFEEPGTLEQVADTAARWFVRHLAPSRRARATLQASPH